jgi:shikimate kinase
MIQLVGPGGAGKTTTGAALAERLGVPFVDLDAEFAASSGDLHSNRVLLRQSSCQPERTVLPFST